MKALRACPICEHDQVRLLHEQRFVLPEGHPLSRGYDVVVCAQCGFVYADTCVPQSEYDAFYATLSKYSDVQTGTGGGDTPWDAERLDETARLLVAHLGATDARILDIGCANGGLLQALRRLGCEAVAGLDPAIACVENTRAKGFAASVGSLLSLPSNIAEYDCVVVSHVLEHVQGLTPAVNALARDLGKSARVYVEVPDARRYADFVYAPFQDFNTEHINHFSPPCLDNLMMRCRFSKVFGGTKVLRSSPHTRYPAFFGMYLNSGDDTDRNAAIDQHDPALESSILEYIRISARRMQEINDHLTIVLREHHEIAVWGVGQLTMKLLFYSPLKGVRIAAFADSNPSYQGRTLAGAPVVSPEYLRRVECPIVIASLLRDTEITIAIRRLGLENPLILLPGARTADSENRPTSNDQTF
jgi:SAM-dependent methyltransferase